MNTGTLPQSDVPQLNILPLTAPLPTGAIRQFKKIHADWWPPSRRVRTIAGSILLLLFLGGCSLAIAALALMVVTAPGLLALGIGGAVIAAVILGFMAFVIYLFVGILRRDVRFGPGWDRMARLDWFAHLNGMMYRPEHRGLRHSGSIFSLGKDPVCTDLLTVSSGRAVQIGNYHSAARSTWDSAHFKGGYVAIQLDRRLPHMIAIAKRRRKFNGQSIAPNLRRKQVLSLEGDFDKYFTLYAPQQYERDALYVFTPDLMVLLIDRLASFDIEIVDNNLYIYSHTPFDLLNPATHARLASIVQVVGRKAMNQTVRYSDDRTDPRFDIVAPAGRRLRTGISASVIIMILYVALRAFYAFHGL